MQTLVNEFRMLRESDYWQYLPETTREKILAILGEEERAQCRYGKEGCPLFERGPRQKS